MKKQIRVAFIGLAMLAPTAIADNTGFYAAIGVSSASGERNDARKQLDKDFRIQADETSIQPAFMVGRMLSENFGVEGGLYRSVLTYPKTADLTVVGASDADNYGLQSSMATKMVSTKLVLEAVGQRAVTEKLYLGASAGVAHIKTTLTNERFKLNSSATNLTWSLRAGFAINPKWYTEIQYRSFGKSAESIAAANNALEQAATNLVLGYRF